MTATAPATATPESPSPAVVFEGVSRHFGTVRAVDQVDLSIADGEFFSMLGPSGSGKTTCLRLIAGFEQPNGGRILIHGRAAAGLPPYERDVNTVFQDYALFPHMSVFDNVGYGPMVRKVPAAERAQRVVEALELVRLTGYESRRPSQLSGGQRQRVALARALINRPRVLLLDEPLGALDLKLREQMQFELKALQRKVGITFVYVTHDQQEALSMSDRLAVFNQGRIEQLATPEEIYDRPATAFVAEFVGSSNVLSGEAARLTTGTPLTFTIRPEKIRLVSANEVLDPTFCEAQGEIMGRQFLGASTRYQLALISGVTLQVLLQNTQEMDGARPPGGRARVAWRRSDIHVLPEPRPS